MTILYLQWIKIVHQGYKRLGLPVDVFVFCKSFDIKKIKFSERSVFFDKIPYMWNNIQGGLVE